MIRIISVDDIAIDGLRVLDEPLPDLSAQPLVLRDDAAACADWLAALGRHLPAEQSERRSLVCSTATPVGIERRFQREDTTVLERIVAAPDRTAAVVEWTASNGVELDLEWRFQDGAELAFLFSTPVEATTVQAGLQCQARVHMAIPAGRAVRLLMTRHVEQAAELDAQRWARTHMAQHEQRRQSLLRLETGDAAFDRAWQWRTFLMSTGSAEANRFIAEIERTLLGCEPDAERGRLVLRPRIPIEWRTFRAHNIAVDDALISLTCEQSRAGCTFTIVQTAGAYPIRLILEPWLSAAPKHAFVDGTPAALNIRWLQDGSTAPVQIMLDERRVVAFDFD
ncbi:MAG TPA: hypothetical protein VF021_10025 [Longimicrobiales bacterium]